MARLLESTFLEGPAGKLDALHEGPDADIEITRAAVVCHPHPLHGGTMHNRVVFRLARAIRSTGAAVLRFNFRGVGSSEGEYDQGRGEREDVKAAVNFMRERHAGKPLIVGGFSFGSVAALRACCDMADVERIVAAGFPADRLAEEGSQFRFLQRCGRPKSFILSTHDEFATRPVVQGAYQLAAPPKELVWVEARDHFFTGALDEFEAAVLAAVQR